MAFRLVIGRGETDHVTSDDFGTLFALTKGDGRYKLDEMTCTVIDANTIHVSAGNLLIDGRHFRNSSEGTNLTIANGSQGMNRIDLVVARYDYITSGEDYIERATLKVIKGESVAGEPSVPSCDGGSILDSDTEVEVPLFTIPINGLAVGTPSACLLDEYELPAKYGGTGIAVEIVGAVKGAIEDATAAAAAANAAAVKATSIREGAVTHDELEQLTTQIAAYHGDYLVVGETVFIPSAKGAYSGDEVTFYSASFNEETGEITLL